MIRKYISRLTVKITVSQNSILFSMLYKRGCFKRKLKLNTDKTNIMVFGNPLQM